MRTFALVLLSLLLLGCDREYKNCFEAAVAVEREQVCNDLWQNCEKAARKRAEASCEAFKPKED